MPKSPSHMYENKGWKGWGDFLGTGTIAAHLRTYRSFKEARKFARSLGLKSGKEWKEYCKSGEKPDDIPNAPRQTYESKGWKGWGDFLGTGTIAAHLRTYRSFKEARKFARSLGLKSRKEWLEYCRTGGKPDDIPTKPERTYKDKGWNGVPDFLGKE